VPVLLTFYIQVCAKIKKNNSSAKRLIFSSHLCLCRPTGLCRLDFLTKTFLSISPLMHATCFGYLTFTDCNEMISVSMKSFNFYRAESILRMWWFLSCWRRASPLMETDELSSGSTLNQLNLVAIGTSYSVGSILILSSDLHVGVSRGLCWWNVTYKM